jgi:hypothetical protein
MKANIEVNATDARSGYAFDVVVREGKSETRHRVTLTEEDLRCFGGGKAGPAALVRESFRFLLEREPKRGVPFLPPHAERSKTLFVSVP